LFGFVAPHPQRVGDSWGRLDNETHPIDKGNEMGYTGPDSYLVANRTGLKERDKELGWEVRHAD